MAARFEELADVNMPTLKLCSAMSAEKRRRAARRAPRHLGQLGARMRAYERGTTRDGARARAQARTAAESGANRRAGGAARTAAAVAAAWRWGVLLWRRRWRHCSGGGAGASSLGAPARRARAKTPSTAA